MDIYVKNERDNKNQRNRKRLSKTDIGIPQDFVHVATVKSPTKTEVNFNDALISEFLQRAEVTASALSDPETQRCIKDFIESVGLDAIRREICQVRAEVYPQINRDDDPSVTHHADERDLHSSLINSTDSSSIAFIPDHDVEITPEIDDVFTEPDTLTSPPKTPEKQELKQSAETKAKHPSESVPGTQGPLESEDLQKSPKPSDSDLTRESLTGDGRKSKKKKSEHDNFLRELKDAIKKRNARLKKKATDEMKKSEEGWSNWNSPTKSKSYVSFFQFDLPPAKPTRTIHTFWDLTSEAHYTETEMIQEQVIDDKDTDSPDGKNHPPNNAKLPLTKRTGAITKMASSEKIASMTLSSTSEEKSNDPKTSSSKEVNEDESMKKIEVDGSNKENIPAESTNEPVACPLNEDTCQREDDNDDLHENKEDSKIDLNKDKSQKKNISSWFSRKNQNKVTDKSMPVELPAEEKKETSAEQVSGIVSDMNESSKSKGEEKKILSIFSSLTKKKQTKEESSSNIGNEKITPEDEKDQPKSKPKSSSKFKLFGSSEKLLDQEKREKEDKKEEKEELETAVVSPTKNDSNKEAAHDVSEIDPSSETNQQKNDIKVLPKEEQTPKSEEEERTKKDDLSKSKAKSNSMKNLLFASGKYSKPKVEKKKEEGPASEGTEPADPSNSERMSKDDEEDSLNKKRSGIMSLLFTPPEKRSKRKEEKKDDKSSKEDTELTSTESDLFVEISLSENETEFRDVKEQELSMEEVIIADEPKNEETKGIPPKKEKTPKKMNFLFTSGKQTKTKLEEKKEEAPKVKPQAANEKATYNIEEEDRYNSWDKSKHSAFVNLLFAPPERHAKKSKSKEKSQNDKGNEEEPPAADDQNWEMIDNKEKESTSNNEESSAENSSSKLNAELANEEEQNETQDTVTKVEPHSVACNQGEMSNSNEEKEISGSETEFSSVVNSSENFEPKNDVVEDNEVRDESTPGPNQGKENKSTTENLENKNVPPAEIISSENITEAIKETKELVPTIIITQDEGCISEDEEEIFTKKEEISSEMATSENFNDLQDKNKQQDKDMEDLKDLITTREEKDRWEEKKDFSRDSKEFITEITKCFDEIQSEVKHEETCEENQELITGEEIICNEKSNIKVSTTTETSTVSISASFSSKECSEQKVVEDKDEKVMEKDLPSPAPLEEMNNEGGNNVISSKEKRLSGIIDSLFARPEKHAKPHQNKKKLNSSKKEVLGEDEIPQSDGSLADKEGSRTETTENEVGLTNIGKPPEDSEVQQISDTPRDDILNPENEMSASLDRTVSSSRMHTLFGSGGKQSKSKKNLKEENTSKKGELSNMKETANEDLKNEEEINSTLDKTKSSSMRKLLFGKRPKQKQEETGVIPPSRATDNEESMGEDEKKPTADEKGSSIDISTANSQKTTEREQGMEKQNEPVMMEELQEDASEKKKPVLKEGDGRTSRGKKTATEKGGFFSLPDRRSKMRNERKNQEFSTSKEEPQNAPKENKEEGKRSPRENPSTPRKKGLLSSLDKRKKVRQEARKPEESLENKENTTLIKPENVESIGNEEGRPFQSGTETLKNVAVEFPNERAVDVGEIDQNSYKLKSESKEDLLSSSSYPRRKGRTRRPLKKEDIAMQKDMRHTTHVTWDPIKKTFVLHYTDNEGLRKVLLEENICREEPAPRQRRHSYSMAMDDADAEIFEDIPRASVQSYTSVTINMKSSGRRRKLSSTRPKSEILRVNQPSTEL